MSHSLVYKIQKFSIHDGPGIRTTVFFKGCPLRCQWCHNPESQSFEPWHTNYSEPTSHAGHTGNTEYIEHLGHPWGIGREWPLSQLVAELEKDRIFYDESDGGVTLSGGEPLAQDIGYIKSLVQILTERGISVVIDTCGDVPYENFCEVLPYTDMFLYDLKFLDSDLHATFTGVSNNRILSNLALLGQEKTKICLRLPLLSGINDSLKTMKEIKAWLDENNIRPFFINLLPYHSYGRNKYADLEMDTPTDFQAPDQKHLEVIKDFWERQGHPAGIGGHILRSKTL